MSHLIIAIDTDADPTLVDPQEMAEDIVSCANDFYHRNGEAPITLLTASWA